MPSHCRTALNIVLTSLFAALVLLTILLAYVTGRVSEMMNTISPFRPINPDFVGGAPHQLHHIFSTRFFTLQECVGQIRSNCTFNVCTHCAF